MALSLVLRISVVATPPTYAHAWIVPLEVTAAATTLSRTPRRVREMKQLDTGWDSRDLLLTSANEHDVELYALVAARSEDGADHVDPPNVQRLHALCRLRRGLASELEPGALACFLFEDRAALRDH